MTQTEFTDSRDRSENQRLVDLMVRYQNGHGEALEELYDQLATKLLNYLYRFQGNREWAEDVLQDVFLKVHRMRHTYRPPGPVKPWLYAIARYAAIDSMRKKTRHAEIDEPEPVLVSHPDHTRSQESNLENRQEIQRHLDKLPKKQKEALVLTKVSGLSVKETAAVLGMSESAVKVNVHRAIKKLRSEDQSASWSVSEADDG